MNGFFVKHTYRGLGKVGDLKPNGISVRFFDSGDVAIFDKDAFSERELVRATLSLRAHCKSGGRDCVIDGVGRSESSYEPNMYEVTFTEDGLRARLSEVDLVPSEDISSSDPLSVLAGLSQGGYSLFQVRENLVSALNQQLRQGSGLRALLSSRIDLRPHQAYVAGLVLLDSKRRFLLADEVGLGKTIEAGIVIHDLLINKPTAKILVVCPGALTQQWLCELYSKFGGHVFKLLELHSPDQIDWSKSTKLIAPFSQAAYEHANQILAGSWDMVVIDEAHHLLSSETLYDFALRLSSTAPSLLLLSAIPAQRREDEFLRLLGLLEPDRYTPAVVADRDRFRELFDAQRAIGRKLRLLRRRLDGLSTGDFTIQETIDQATDLLTLPVLQDDKSLSEKVNGLSSQTANFQRDANEILHYVGDTYRINRRILRNRRQRLVEEEQIVPIERKLSLCPYEAEQLEHEVNQSVHNLIAFANEQELRDELLMTLSRVLWQSTVHPQAVCDVLTTLLHAEARNLNEKGIDFLANGYLCGYAEWDAYLELLCKAVRHSVSEELLHQAITCATRWKRDGAGFSRYAELVKSLKQKAASRGPLPKVLVFAGFPNVAADLTERLRRTFGDNATAEFRSDLDREEKEANVRQFRSDSATWLMVSDESGGEGRNFQFADSLIHFDTPWYISRVEQRIGRLDRLGRENESHTDVVSEVIFDDTSVEGCLVLCYDAGIGVYRCSISGLEFALREVEARIARTAIEDGREGLSRIVGDITSMAEEERSRDESEALLDEASFDRVSAEKFRRVRHSEQNELALEASFTEYLRMIASNRSVRRFGDSEFSEGVWKLRADEIHQIRDKSTNGLVDQTTPFTGTFRRAIAQQRLDLQFFNLGHPLFETLCHALFNDTVGRSYGMEIKDFSRDPWVGFEFVFYPTPEAGLLADNIGLQNQARQYFSFQPAHVFCRIDGRVEEESDAILNLRQRLERADKDQMWRNITKNKALVLQDVFTSPSWDELVFQLFETAKDTAKNRFRNEVETVVIAASKQLAEQMRQLSNLNGDPREVQHLQDLRQSLKNWQLQLDSVGFLSVNGRILERTMNARS
jgi:ATP-dependent helicase HepA